MKIYVNQAPEGWEWGLSHDGRSPPSEWFSLRTRSGLDIDSGATDAALARHARRAADVGLVDVAIRRIGHEGRDHVSERRVRR